MSLPQQPPSSTPPGGDIPRATELLLKKAAIDDRFREDLVSRRSRVADEQGVPLTAEERLMLDGSPESQLRALIRHTRVPEDQRRGLASGCLVAALAGILTAVVAVPNFRKARGHEADSPITCRANMAALAGAVERFNMDAPNPEALLREITPENLERVQRLLQSRQPAGAPSIFRCPGCQEAYFGKDLTGSGTLFCKLHGPAQR